MKGKNLLVVCAAAGLCMICALLLAGSMGIYAEKAGTGEFEPEMAESETPDALTEILSENSEEGEVQAEGTVSEDKLREIWDNMYEAYAGSEDVQKELAFSKDTAGEDAGETENTTEKAAAAAVGKETEDISENGYHITLNSAEVGVHEAGLIVLKEINRLYSNDTLDDLKIEEMQLYCDSDENGEYLWEGMLGNGYQDNDENYRSYSFEIDCVSGSILSFGKFHPYQKDKDYSVISWTEDEIKAHAKELIEKYDLTEGEELDWSQVEIFNGTDQLESLKEELEEEPDLSVSIGNTLIFEKDGKRCFYLHLDWETGEIGNYVRQDHHMSKF